MLSKTTSEYNSPLVGGRGNEKDLVNTPERSSRGTGGDKSQPSPALVSKRRCWLKRWFLRGLMLLVVLFGGAEMFARWWLGLGDPPLSQADPEIAYLFKPNQTCRRFGNLIHYNAYSMRSDDFPPHKSDPTEIRIMVIGDSIVNGGSLTDQSDVITSILQRRLTADLHQPVIVMNVSAGGWGPPNQLAYLKRYGFFDADVVVLEMASHDYADTPKFEPLVGVNPGFPDQKPMLALQEAWTRYLIPRLRQPKPGEPPRQSDINWCRASERTILDRARATGAAVLLAQYLEQAEMGGQLLPGYAANRQVAEEASVPVVDFGPEFNAACSRGETPFRDAMHPNVRGNHLMADVLVGPIKDALARRQAGQCTTRQISRREIP